MAGAPGQPTRPIAKLHVFRLLRITLVLAVLGLSVWFIADEMRTSHLQARYLSELGEELAFSLEPGDAPVLPSPTGPYDARAGYTRIGDFSQRLQARGFTVSEAARAPARMIQLSTEGLYPAYREKDRLGLSIHDEAGQVLHGAGYPERTYARFEDIPAVLVTALLFIENKELLDTRFAQRNPAVEWDRFAQAVVGQLMATAGVAEDDAGGGSTLATQIEKYRHSPEGRTTSKTDKLRQMASASVRAYLHGPDTEAARKMIVLAYLNTVPLAAKAGFGEVNGMGDGLFAWYGLDFDTTNQTLRSASVETVRERGRLFRAALSLMIAQRRPAWYLGGGAERLESLTDSYLRLMAQDGAISPQLRDAALVRQVRLDTAPLVPESGSFVERKAATALRSHLSEMLGVSNFYALDRLDLDVTTTLNARVQQGVIHMLQALKDPAVAREAGLDGQRMLGGGEDPGKVIYSFTLYERTPAGNALRVQADNYDQPFDINEGARLDLGSTAKLRTLVTYLEVIADVHSRYAGRSAEVLDQAAEGADTLSRWTLGQLRRTPEMDLRTLLDAAMDRSYSASPKEPFYTGGGQHYFGNFNHRDDNRVVTVREALRHSINLAFIRMMRDIVQYHIHINPSADRAIVSDANDPRRAYYLSRFADREGRTFLSGFYRKYAGKSTEARRDLLLQSAGSPKRAAAALRSIRPELDEAAYSAQLRAHVGDSAALDEARIAGWYKRFDPAELNLPDQGYLARVHPLELWLVRYLSAHPEASLAESLEASVDERQAVYNWLFRTRHKNAQDVRIRSLLEVEAFIAIGRSWQRLGYPFDSLTPSYASSIGSSGDRPAALARLMGLIVNGGMSLPVVRFDQLHFAADTPYERRFTHRPAEGERLLPQALTEVVREAVIDVATQGTARRVAGAFTLADGTVVPVGGKTGTGDHRIQRFDRGGRKVSEQVVSRSATFVFLIGDRFFGTLTAYVGGADAERYVFTSALAVQLLRALAPTLMPLMDVPAPVQPTLSAESEHPA